MVHGDLMLDEKIFLLLLFLSFFSLSLFLSLLCVPLIGYAEWLQQAFFNKNCTTCKDNQLSHTVSEEM